MDISSQLGRLMLPRCWQVIVLILIVLIIIGPDGGFVPDGFIVIAFAIVLLGWIISIIVSGVIFAIFCHV